MEHRYNENCHEKSPVIGNKPTRLPPCAPQIPCRFCGIKPGLGLRESDNTPQEWRHGLKDTWPNTGCHVFLCSKLLRCSYSRVSFYDGITFSNIWL